MRNLIASLLLISSLNMWAQQPGMKPLSSAEPGPQVRQEFLRAYNAKDADAVVALYAEDATLVSDGGTFKGRDEIRKWVKAGLDQGSRLEAIEPGVEKSSGNLAYGAGSDEKACWLRHSYGTVPHCDGEDWCGVEDCAALFAQCRRNPSRECRAPIRLRMNHIREMPGL